jgi:hypothetical protein
MIYHLQIYPNPARDYFIVEVDDIVVDRYELFDLNGKLLIQRDPVSDGREVLETGTLNPGVYILKVISDGERLTGRIVIF